MPKTIYLANPYGFSAQQKAELLPPLVSALEALGLEVWEPFSRNNQVDFAEAGWAYRIGQADFRDVAESDAIFAVVNGVPPDEGVMVELGMAIALGKPTFLFRDDFRRVVESEQYPLEPDAVHRPPRARLGGLLLHLAGRDTLAGEGPRAVGEGALVHKGVPKPDCSGHKHLLPRSLHLLRFVRRTQNNNLSLGGREVQSGRGTKTLTHTQNIPFLRKGCPKMPGNVRVKQTPCLTTARPTAVRR